MAFHRLIYHLLGVALLLLATGPVSLEYQDGGSGGNFNDNDHDHINGPESYFGDILENEVSTIVGTIFNSTSDWFETKVAQQKAIDLTKTTTATTTTTTPKPSKPRKKPKKSNKSSRYRITNPSMAHTKVIAELSKFENHTLVEPSELDNYTAAERDALEYALIKKSKLRVDEALLTSKLFKTSVFYDKAFPVYWLRGNDTKNALHHLSDGRVVYHFNAYLRTVYYTYRGHLNSSYNRLAKYAFVGTTNQRLTTQPLVAMMLRNFSAPIKEECLGNASTVKTEDYDCQPFWDKTDCICWPGGKINETVTIPCPDYIFGFYPSQNASITCLENGTYPEGSGNISTCTIRPLWFPPPTPEPEPAWPDYGSSEEFPFDDEFDVPSFFENGTLIIKQRIDQLPQTTYFELLSSHTHIINVLSFFGYFLSFIAVTIAIFIMTTNKQSSRRLICMRTKLHLLLFISYLLRCIVCLAKIYFLDRLHEPKPDLTKDQDIILHDWLEDQEVSGQIPRMEVLFQNGTEGSLEEVDSIIDRFLAEQNWTNLSSQVGEFDDFATWKGLTYEQYPPWFSLVFGILWNYTLLANYNWLLMEGFHLHRILFDPLRVPVTMTPIKLFGWLAPVPFVLAWSYAHYYFKNAGWEKNDLDNLYLIIDVPIYVSFFVNVYFFMHIFAILRTKIFTRVGIEYGKREQNSYKRLFYSTLHLFVLMGIHYAWSLLIYFVIYFNQWIYAKLAYMYYVMTLNTFQGCFVAIMFCFSNGEVQTELMQSWSNSCIRRYLGNSETGIGMSNTQSNSRSSSSRKGSEGQILRSQRPKGRSKSRSTGYNSSNSNSDTNAAATGFTLHCCARAALTESPEPTDPPTIEMDAIKPTHSNSSDRTSEQSFNEIQIQFDGQKTPPSAVPRTHPTWVITNEGGRHLEVSRGSEDQYPILGNFEGTRIVHV